MEKITKLKKLIDEYNLDGYIVPKNDEFFGEYIPEHKDKLKFISNFSGSYGFALILKKKNYLFVDGRYTLQAKIQSGKYFKIVTIPNKFPSDILKNKFNIGFDPKLHTQKNLNFFFSKTNSKLIAIKQNLIDKLWIKKKRNENKKFYILPKKAIGLNHSSKINKLLNILKEKKLIFNLLQQAKILRGF